MLSTVELLAANRFGAAFVGRSIRLGVAAFGCERLEAAESSRGVPFQRGDRVVAQPGDG